MTPRELTTTFRIGGPDELPEQAVEFAARVSVLSSIDVLVDVGVRTQFEVQCDFVPQSDRVLSSEASVVSSLRLSASKLIGCVELLEPAARNVVLTFEHGGKKIGQMLLGLTPNAVSRRTQRVPQVGVEELQVRFKNFWNFSNTFWVRSSHPDVLFAREEQLNLTALKEAVVSLGWGPRAREFGSGGRSVFLNVVDQEHKKTELYEFLFD